MSDAAEKKWLITGQEQTFTGAEPKHILDNSNDIDEKEITERIIRWYQDHFYVQCKSPWNLGLELNEDSLWAGKLPLHVQNFVGMMPLLGNTGRPEPGWVLNIAPHPGINPMEMLRAVMEGEDYYEQPELLQVRNFSPRELATRRSGNWQSKERWDNTVLFGRIEGVGKLTLDGTPKDAFLGGSDKQASLLPAMSNLLGTLEIIEFVQKTKQLLQKNVLHTMERVEENLTGKVRGKILLNRQLRMNILRGQPQKVYCAYSRLSANNRENIILRWALHLCENFSQGLADNLMDDIFSCKRALADVPLVKCGLQDFVGLKTNGAYREYKQALDAAKQIIGQFSITYTTTNIESDKKASPKGQERNSTEKTEFAPREIVPFFLDMNYLFELYCRAVLRRALDGEKLRSAKWRLEPKQRRALFNKDLSTTFMHEYEPDMTVVDQAGKPVVVLDAKNSNVEENTKYRRDRTHQILFYMQALDCRFGILMGRVEDFIDGEEDTNALIPLYRNGQPVAEGEAPNGWLSSLLFRQGSFEDHVKAVTAVLVQVGEKLRIEQIKENIRDKKKIIKQLQEIPEKKNQRQKETLKDSLQEELNQLEEALNNLNEERITLEGSQNGRQ